MASEYLKWKYRDVKPDAPRVLTPKEKRANWWHYHKWTLLLGIVVAVAAVDIALRMLGVGQIRPDYQVALAVSAPVDDATLAVLETAFAALGEDCSGDGRVTVAVHPYVTMAASQDSDAARYAAVAKIKLMADMEARESYFFICDDPETLHSDYQILADAGGGIAAHDEDIYFLPCGSVPALSGLGLDDLYLARRGFWEDRTCRYRDQCDVLWNRLAEGVAS